MWGCDKGDKVKHFYVFVDPERYPVCDPDLSRIRSLTKGDKKPKCKECMKVLGES